MPRQCCVRYYLEDSIFMLKIQDSILSCIFKILSKTILTKRKILFEDTFHNILFVHCVRYSTRNHYGYAYITWLHGMTIILEHNSIHQQIHARLITYGIVGLKQSPNFLSMRLVQVVNNIKVSSEKYLQACIFGILLKSIFILYLLNLQDTFKKYLAQHWLPGIGLRCKYISVAYVKQIKNKEHPATASYCYRSRLEPLFLSFTYCKSRNTIHVYSVTVVR